MINSVDPLVNMVHNPEESLPDDKEDKVRVEPHEDYVLKSNGTVDTAF